MCFEISLVVWWYFFCLWFRFFGGLCFWILILVVFCFCDWWIFVFRFFSLFLWIGCCCDCVGVGWWNWGGRGILLLWLKLLLIGCLGCWEEYVVCGLFFWLGKSNVVGVICRCFVCMGECLLFLVSIVFRIIYEDIYLEELNFWYLKIVMVVLL